MKLFPAALSALLLFSPAAAPESGDDDAAPVENRGEKVDASLAQAILLYQDGDYEGAIETLERVAISLKLGHTARDAERAAKVAESYFMNVMEGDFEAALALLHLPFPIRRDAEDLARIHAEAREAHGLSLHGFSVLRVRFDAPERAWADVLVTGPGNAFAEGALRLKKLYVDEWAIGGYPAHTAGSLSCLLPLEAQPRDCGESAK